MTSPRFNPSVAAGILIIAALSDHKIFSKEEGSEDIEAVVARLRENEVKPPQLPIEKVDPSIHRPGSCEWDRRIERQQQAKRDAKFASQRGKVGFKPMSKARSRGR